MIYNFDFAETNDKVYLTFYKPPKAKIQLDSIFNNPKIEMPDSKTIIINTEIINLFASAHLKNIELNDFKLEIVLIKEIPKRWNGIDGKKPKIEINDKIYERMPLKNEGSESSMIDIFKNIYENGDDSVKRAMNKSLNESAGTVLSTDWESVKSKHIKPEE